MLCTNEHQATNVIPPNKDFTLSMVDNDQLRRDIFLLEDLLASVVMEDEGKDAVQLVTEIRQLARDRRTSVPGAEAALSRRIHALDQEQIRTVARSLSVFFDLANIAEDRQRVRVLRQREQDLHPNSIGESIGAAIRQLKDAGLNAERVQKVLEQLDVELVFTVHPSEAKRRSIRAKLRRMRHCLEELDRVDLLPRERANVLNRLRGSDCNVANRFPAPDASLRPGRSGTRAFDHAPALGSCSGDLSVAAPVARPRIPGILVFSAPISSVWFMDGRRP